MTKRKRLPPEIRKMRLLGKYSSAMAHYATTSAETWRTINRSDDPEAPELLELLVATCRELILQFETARLMLPQIGSLLIPDPTWQPPEE